MKTIERTIITALLRDMRAAGYQPAAVWDSEEYVLARADGTFLLSNVWDNGTIVERPWGTQRYALGTEPIEIARPLSDEEVLVELDSVDADCTLHFTHHNATTWGNRGVLLIQGNDEDVISDCHCADDEPFEGVIEAIYERITKGELA